MKNKTMFGFAGIFAILMIGLVSATTLETDVNQQLIIRSTCNGVNAFSEIMIFDINNELIVPREVMTAISATDFVYTTSFWQEGVYRAEIECTFENGFHSFETIAINVVPSTNMIQISAEQGYDYEALLDYNVFFKADPTLTSTIDFRIGEAVLTFQPTDLVVTGTIIGDACKDKTIKRDREDAKLELKRSREDTRLIAHRAEEDAKHAPTEAVLEKRIKQDEKIVAHREKEDEKIASKRAKEDKKCSKKQIVLVSDVTQSPENNGVSVEGNTLTYTGVYGPGLDLEYRVNKDYVKEELVIADVSSLPDTNQLSGTMTLNLNSVMTTTSKIIVDGNEWDQAAPITTANKVLIQDNNGNIIYQLEIPVAFDSAGEKLVGKYILTPLETGSIEVSVEMDYEWFTDSTRVYPVYLDPTVVWDGTSNLKGEIPYIVIDNLTIPVNQSYTINEIIMWGSDSIVDAECELDIINDVTQVKVVDFRSFFNNQGIYQYTWTPEETGAYTASQYCWHGDTLDLNKIYQDSSIVVVE